MGSTHLLCSLTAVCASAHVDLRHRAPFQYGQFRYHYDSKWCSKRAFKGVRVIAATRACLYKSLAVYSSIDTAGLSLHEVYTGWLVS